MGLITKIGSAIGNFVGSSSGIGTIFQAGAGLLGNLIGAKSQKAANEMNYQINQMNNEFNERMMEKQMRYNSASEQVKRYKEAGLNPALMMQGQAAGQASNTTASSAAPIQGYGYDFSSIGNAIASGIQINKENELLDGQIKQLNIENDYLKQKQIQELANLKEQELSSKAKRKIDDITAKNLDQLQTSEYYRNMAQKDDYRSQIEKRTAEKLLLDKEIATFDQRFDYEKALAVSQVMLNGAVTNRTKQEMRTEVFNTVKAQYEAANQKVEARTAARIADAIVDKAYNDADKSYYEAFHKVSSPAEVAGRASATFDREVQGNIHKKRRK